jgi:hypothetical protein
VPGWSNGVGYTPHLQITTDSIRADPPSENSRPGGPIRMPDNLVTNILSTQRNPTPLNIHASDALHCLLERDLHKTLKREHEPASSQSR